jgi:LuxR family transcriptional regulator, activator of conjugal transfer of Ti plasmids
MHHTFRNFIDSLSSASDANGLRDAMAGAADALELSCFAYLSVPRRPRSNPILITNYPLAWTEHYLRCQYERLDPVIIQAFRSYEPFEWGLETGTMVESKLQKELFAEAAAFGIRHGFTVPIHDNQGPVAAVTFAADARKPEFEKCINEHARVLQLMAMYFHAHARRRFASDRLIGGVSLSPRESECLEWAAQGKSAWEIGRILGISRRTAAFHLDNAKAKLGVHSICQAVASLIASKATVKNPFA